LIPEGAQPSSMLMPEISVLLLAVLLYSEILVFGILVLIAKVNAMLL